MASEVMMQLFLFGFVCALPFVAVKRYATRLLLSVGTVLAIYYLVFVLGLRSHGAYWDNLLALIIGSGGFCGAHVRTAWESIQAAIRRRREAAAQNSDTISSN
jgi:hypothetical protein